LIIVVSPNCIDSTAAGCDGNGALASIFHSPAQGRPGTVNRVSNRRRCRGRIVTARRYLNEAAPASRRVFERITRLPRLRSALRSGRRRAPIASAEQARLYGRWGSGSASAFGSALELLKRVELRLLRCQGM
jgi:hypothetical protein